MKNFYRSQNDKILKKLRQVADEEGRTTTELIREAVAELLGRREKGSLGIERR